ncbi:MAG TPA: benzoyl-CoA reductase subunit C [Planctomycetes bacterium]|nr:benzoyl-CoA reductase subunit C [Planctomycetota bacterium]
MTDKSSNPATALIQEQEALYRDYSFPEVQKWKARTGGLAIGFMPIQIPRELLHAMNVLPVGIVGAGDDIEIIRGDAYFQSYICHIPRSTIELGLNGSLDCLDGMIFPAICDVIRNLSGMWKLQFPDKFSWYLDVPQDFDPEIGGQFYRHELKEMAKELERRGARPLTDEALKASIEIYNKHRALVKELYDLRIKEPWKVPTAELYVLLRAGLVVPVEDAIQTMQRYLDLVRADETRKPMDQARVLLVGSFCEQPPLGLIRSLERAGCYIVDDDLVQVHRWIKHEIAPGDDPLGALVNAFLTDSVESPTRYIDEGERGQEIVKRTEDAVAEGVLFCAPSFCDPALLDQPMTVKAIEKAGIPWTAFKYSEDTGQFQVIREQAGTFADSIKLWSGV